VSDVRESARRFLDRGERVIPLKPGSKHFRDGDTAFTKKYAPEDFAEGENIGEIPSTGISTVDLDWPEAVRLAPYFLPLTSSIYGRRAEDKKEKEGERWVSRERSHYRYRTPDLTSKLVYSEVAVTKTPAGKRRRTTGSTMLELRAGLRLHNMVPPSRYGEDEVAWIEDGEAAAFPLKELKSALSLLAAASAVLRWYPPAGGRHFWVLAVVGALRKLKVSRSDAERLIRRVAEAAGDSNVEDRLKEVATTYDRSEDDPTTGLRTLEDFDDESLAETLVAAFGLPSERSGFLLTEKGSISQSKPENVLVAL
jgi:hypothetical protein